MLVPDRSAEVRVDFGDGSAPEHFFIGDIPTTDGSPWECFPREFLRRATVGLAAHGYGLIAAFEQEFVYSGIQDQPGAPYSLSAFRRQGVFGQTMVAAMRAAGVAPDSFLPEYGARQFEVTAAPATPLQAAHHARAGASYGVPTRPSREFLADDRSSGYRQRSSYPYEPARRGR
jgi:glutamine synthetase